MRSRYPQGNRALVRTLCERAYASTSSNATLTDSGFAYEQA
ncbi:hypothetical protein [Tolypothrix sp. FACHB-123]|nr:hypothetical protein [Tolypothrix sp. FACHB-123]